MKYKLTTLESSAPATALPDLVELLLDQTRASLLCGNLNACYVYLELAVNAAADLGSGLHRALCNNP